MSEENNEIEKVKGVCSGFVDSESFKEKVEKLSEALQASSGVDRYKELKDTMKECSGFGKQLTDGLREVITSGNPKSLDVTSVEDLKEKVSDVVVVGDGNLFKILSKASSKSQGWMKSTKAMEVVGGCVVQVTTQNWDQVAEAVTYVPGVKIGEDVNGGRKLIPIYTYGECDPACNCEKSQDVLR